MLRLEIELSALVCGSKTYLLAVLWLRGGLTQLEFWIRMSSLLCIAAGPVSEPLTDNIAIHCDMLTT